MGSVMTLPVCWLYSTQAAMRERDPHRTVTHQELDVHGVGMAGRNGDDQRLVSGNARGLPRPAVDCLEVVIHI